MTKTHRQEAEHHLLQVAGLGAVLAKLDDADDLDPAAIASLGQLVHDLTHMALEALSHEQKPPLPLHRV